METVRKILQESAARAFQFVMQINFRKYKTRNVSREQLSHLITFFYDSTLITMQYLHTFCIYTLSRMTFQSFEVIMSECKNYATLSNRKYVFFPVFPYVEC